MCDIDLNGPICLKQHGLFGDPGVLLRRSVQTLVLNLAQNTRPRLTFCNCEVQYRYQT